MCMSGFTDRPTQSQPSIYPPRETYNNISSYRPHPEPAFAFPIMFSVDILLFETTGNFPGQKPMVDYNMRVRVPQFAPLTF